MLLALAVAVVARIAMRHAQAELAGSAARTGAGFGVAGLMRQTVAKLGGEVQIAPVASKGAMLTLRLPLSTALGQAQLQLARQLRYD